MADTINLMSVLGVAVLMQHRVRGTHQIRDRYAGSRGGDGRLQAFVDNAEWILSFERFSRG